MAINLLQSNQNTSSNASTVVTWTNNNTAGDFICVFVATNATTGNPVVSSITDTQGNTYKLKGSQNYTVPQTIAQEVWYAQNIKAGTNPVLTVNYINPLSECMVIANEYSGVNQAQPFDRDDISEGSGANVSMTMATDSLYSNELLIAFAINDANSSPAWTMDSGFENLQTQSNGFGMAVEDRQIPATGTYTATFTTDSGNWAGLLLSLVPPAGAQIVQSRNGTSATSSLTINYFQATATNNLLIGAVRTNGAAPTVSGFSSVGIGLNNNSKQVYLFYVASTGQSSITFSSTGANSMQGIIVEYAGMTFPIVLDASSTAGNATGTGANITSGAISTTFPSDLILELLGTQSNTALSGTAFATASTTHFDGLNFGNMFLAEYIPISTTVSNYTDFASWSSPNTQRSIVVAAFEVDPNVSSADFITTSESAGYYSELVATRESVVANVVSNQSVLDLSVTSENVAVSVADGGSTLSVNVSDSVTASESIVVSIKSAAFLGSASDTATTSENVVVTKVLLVNVSDSVVTNESLALFMPFYALVANDTLVTAENIQVALPFIFIDTESLTMLVRDPIGLSLSVPSAINLTVVIE